VPGHSGCRKSCLEVDRVLKGHSGVGLLDSYGEERLEHVRLLTTRIKAIGHVICERDPVAAEARDVRILAEGGGRPRTFTRQEIVPPLQKGLLAFPLHPAHGTLFPQPWIRTAVGRRLLDAVAGTGWRLVLDVRNEPDLTAGVRADLTRLGMRLIRVCSADATDQAEPDAVAEEDGVLAAWFDRYGLPGRDRPTGPLRLRCSQRQERARQDALRTCDTSSMIHRGTPYASVHARQERSTDRSHPTVRGNAASSDQKSQANTSRRITILGLSYRVLLTGVALCLSNPVVAQSWPQRPVSVVVPQAAGNSPDVLCRIIAEKLSRAIGQQFVVENRPGAANLVGTQSVARAAPDGYTFLFATSAALVTNPYTFKTLPYDPVKDFTPVAMVARSNHVVLVNPEVKAKTLAELIALEKSAPGSLSLAVDGPRNLSGLIAQSINKQAGTGFVLIPYNTTTNAVQDSITGRVQVTIQAASIAAPFITAGTLRPLLLRAASVSVRCRTCRQSRKR
jgi:tripartite-type tricarboxylate transporter receptor subunit TctC